MGNATLIAVNPFDLVIFGATGDLAARKLLPALYHRHCAGQLPQQARIIALGRNDLSSAEYIASTADKSQQYITEQYLEADEWQSFIERIDYLQLDADSDADFARLAEHCGMRRIAFEFSTCRLRPICLQESASAWRVVSWSMSTREWCWKSRWVTISKVRI